MPLLQDSFQSRKSPGVEALRISLGKFGRTIVELERISLAVSKFRGSLQTASCPFSRLRKIACTATAEPPNVKFRHLRSSEFGQPHFSPLKSTYSWRDSGRAQISVTATRGLKALRRHDGTCRV